MLTVYGMVSITYESVVFVTTKLPLPVIGEAAGPRIPTFKTSPSVIETVDPVEIAPPFF